MRSRAREGVGEARGGGAGCVLPPPRLDAWVLRALPEGQRLVDGAICRRAAPAARARCNFHTLVVAGMFLWLKLTHVRDSRALIQEKARERKVLLVPGADFDSEQGAISSYVRASFSTASAVDMEEAVGQLSDPWRLHFLLFVTCDI
jgi:aspartate/methionine/tyrosine aminotransferase